MPWVAGIASAAIGAGTSIWGANKQKEAIADATNASGGQLAGGQARADAQLYPYQQTGAAAQGRLTGMLGLEHPAGEAPNLYDDLSSANAATGNLSTVKYLGPREDWVLLTPQEQVAKAQNIQRRLRNSKLDMSMNAVLGPFQQKVQAWERINGEAATGNQDQAPEFLKYDKFQYDGADRPGLFDYNGAPSEYEKFSPEEINKDPGYLFRLEEGRRKLEGAMAARGLMKSGKFARDLSRFSQGLASTEYDKAFRRHQTEFERRRDTEKEQYGRALTGYGLDTAHEGETRRRALQDWSVGYGQARDESNDEYSRWSDQWNRLASVAGKAQTASEVASEQARNTGRSLAGNETNAGINSANATGAAASSITNLVGDIASGYSYYSNRQPQTQDDVATRPPEDTSYRSWE